MSGKRQEYAKREDRSIHRAWAGFPEGSREFKNPSGISFAFLFFLWIAKRWEQVDAAQRVNYEYRIRLYAKA